VSGDVSAASTCDDEEYGCTEDGAEALADPVADHFAGFHSAGCPDAEADGGVDVTAGDGSDAVGGTDEGETEGNGNAKYADLVPGDHGGAAAEEHQDEGADEFSKVFFHEFLQEQLLAS
jgi:hypothetical protein